MLFGTGMSQLALERQAGTRTNIRHSVAGPIDGSAMHLLGRPFLHTSSPDRASSVSVQLFRIIFGEIKYPFVFIRSTIEFMSGFDFVCGLLPLLVLLRLFLHCLSGFIKIGNFCGEGSERNRIYVIYCKCNFIPK